MLKLNQTNLETFNFGEADQDKFYVLINTLKNPEGITISKLAMADPRRFDSILAEMGCIVMLSGEEVSELVLRKEIDPERLHETLFDLAKKEGVIF